MAHLTHEQRYTISVLLKAEKNKNEIAEIIGKHPSVICNRKYCLRMKEMVEFTQTLLKVSGLF